jgi:hypothetical protein
MELLKNIILVIISPRVGWEDVSQSSIPTGKIMANAFLPLLAVLAISAFVPMVYDSTLTLSESLLSAIVQFASYFFTYFISSYMLSVFYPELVKTKTALDRLNDYILYNLIYLVLLSIAGNILPIEFAPVFFLMLYMPWIAYRGVEYLGVAKKKVTKFVIIASVMMLLLPLVISFLLNLFIK